jgi:hypothetical protein
LRRVEKVRSKVRRHVWQLLPGVPASKVAGMDLGATVVLDVDATLITAHSEKEQAAATFKHGFGFHPIGVWCDYTHELLAIMLRPGNAGSNHAEDHIVVLTRAIAQIPTGHRNHLLVRADGAGATHQLLDWLTAQGQVAAGEWSTRSGSRKNAAVTSAIARLPARAWTPAVTSHGELREHADVAEVTGLLNLSGWPKRMRVIVRREHPHPGAQLSLFEASDGYRYQAFATNTGIGQLAFLEARHRAHARVEDRIKAAKDSGLGRLPSREYAINQVWVQLAAVAADLIAWLQMLALDGDLAKAETAALPDAAHARAAHPRQPATPPPHPLRLAVGRRHPRRVPPDHDHPGAHLSRRADHPTDPRNPRRPAPERHPDREHAHTSDPTSIWLPKSTTAGIRMRHERRRLGTWLFQRSTAAVRACLWPGRNPDS